MQHHDTTSATPAPRKPRKNATQKSSVALRMNDGLLERLDAYVAGRGYPSRTDAIEDAVRAMLEREGA
jgi:metal-responsive CopG/Arc/MetJ family transcriptional regulator